MREAGETDRQNLDYACIIFYNCDIYDLSEKRNSWLMKLKRIKMSLKSQTYLKLYKIKLNHLAQSRARYFIISWNYILF